MRARVSRREENANRARTEVALRFSWRELSLSLSSFPDRNAEERYKGMEEDDKKTARDAARGESVDENQRNGPA